MDNGFSKDITARITKVKGVMAGFSKIWGSREIKYNTKIDLVRACVFSLALYAC